MTISDAGVAWSTKRLVLDSLRVLRASADAIVCSGDVGERMATITLSPDTGASALARRSRDAAIRVLSA